YAPIKTHAAGSGLFKSTDGGKSWTKLTKGLPNAKMGRIGLDWSLKNPNLVLAIVDSEKTGTGLPPSRGYLGVTPENTDKGIRVANVAEKGPAADKLAKGDMILSLDGKDLKEVNELLLSLGPKNPGDKIKLGIQRGDKKEVVEITLGAQPGK